MRIVFKEIRTLFGMAFVANLGLRCLGQHRVARRVNLVATDTGDIPTFMCASHPADAGIALMAVQTNLVLLFGCHRVQFVSREFGGGSKGNDGRLFFTRPHLLGMSSPWAVTSLTLQTGERRTFVVLLRVFGFEN